MIPVRIKAGVQQDAELIEYLDRSGYGRDWSLFTRVVFNGIARRINRRVTEKVIQTPDLIGDRWLIGEDALRNLFFRNKWSTVQGRPVVETVTEGQYYRSSKVELRDGILYIECENLEFNEKENHVFYVGNDTRPEVIFGISSTISVKKKLPIGIRNVLVRQASAPEGKMAGEREMPFSAAMGRLSEEEAAVVSYFQRQPLNLLPAGYSCSLKEMKNR